MLKGSNLLGLELVKHLMADGTILEAKDRKDFRFALGNWREAR
jgi:hypothetical protein